MEYREMHDSLVKSYQESGFIHGDHIHAACTLMLEFTPETQEKFVAKCAEYGEEFANDIKEHISKYDISKVEVPIVLPMHYESEEDFEAFLGFVADVSKEAKLHSYTVLSEIFFENDEEEHEHSQEEEGCGCGSCETEHSHEEEGCDCDSCETEEEGCGCGCGCGSENGEFFPSIFTETCDGHCFITTLDYNGNAISEYSGEFEKGDPFVEGLRFPLFD